MKSHKSLYGIRSLNAGNLASLLWLEEHVWRPRGIESLSEDTGARWLKEGICFGYFDQGELKGYVYGEVIDFRPIPPYSIQLVAALESYKNTRSAPDGNALHGISMAVSHPGVGGPLLEAMVEEARRRGFCYFVSLARLEGLGRFVRENRNALRSLAEPLVAALYAIQAVSWIDPALVGEPLWLMGMPTGFPKIRRKDTVISRFARLGKELWGVAKTSFDDPQSLGYSALLVLPL